MAKLIITLLIDFISKKRAIYGEEKNSLRM
jgi:hypothetical protein